LSREGQSIYNFLMKQDIHDKNRLIDEWKTKYKVDEQIKKIARQCFALMNEKQLKQLASSSLVELGSHTHSHHLLSLLTDEKLRFELQHSKSLLEKITGKRVESIAFPDGAYDKRVMDFCVREGYKHLVAVGLNEQTDRDISGLIPRMGVSCSDGLAFNMLCINYFFNTNGF
jgi:peptidoglycan/xylan/chitin deacetylase (PgdA/CDA1 family)